jgi:hypothetical protein
MNLAPDSSRGQALKLDSYSNYTFLLLKQEKGAKFTRSFSILKHWIFIQILIYIFNQFIWRFSSNHFSVHKRKKSACTFAAIPKTAIFYDIQVIILFQLFKRFLRAAGQIADAKFDDWLNHIFHLSTLLMLPFLLEFCKKWIPFSPLKCTYLPLHVVYCQVSC